MALSDRARHAIGVEGRAALLQPDQGRQCLHLQQRDARQAGRRELLHEAIV
jgi:hypothetical protein